MKTSYVLAVATISSRSAGEASMKGPPQ